MAQVRMGRPPTAAWAERLAEKERQKKVQLRIDSDRYEPLPVHIVQQPPHEVFIRQCAMLCTAAAKKVAICTLNGQNKNLDQTIESILLQVWNNGYNSGLKDMDQMHHES